MEVPVGVSKRHVHLNKETCTQLFGNDELPIRNELTQPGQYASTLTVDIEWNGKILEHVRIVGPIRDYNQIELSDEECRYLEVDPPARQSGDLDGSLPIILIGPKGKVNVSSGLIRAERHIHMTVETAKELNLENKEPVEVYYNKEYKFKAIIKITDPAYNELHIDTEEEKIFNLHQNDIVEFKKCGK